MKRPLQSLQRPQLMRLGGCGNSPNRTNQKDYNMNQQSPSPYSLVDQLSDEAESRFPTVNMGGRTLDVIMMLSGILSAVYFWQNALVMFVGLPEFVATMLALICGFAPNEGAFFAWKSIRTEKQNMTGIQIGMTAAGAGFAVAGSLLGTMSLFVTSLRIVPADLVEMRTWLAFIALAFPMVTQVIIIAIYAITERQTIENEKRAKLNAMGFDAFMKQKTAQIAAIIRGTEQKLATQLDGYGQRQGAIHASDFLDVRGAELLGMGEPLRDPDVKRQPAPRPGGAGEPALTDALGVRYPVSDSDDRNKLPLVTRFFHQGSDGEKHWHYTQQEAVEAARKSGGPQAVCNHDGLVVEIVESANRQRQERSLGFHQETTQVNRGRGLGGVRKRMPGKGGTASLNQPSSNTPVTDGDSDTGEIVKEIKDKLVDPVVRGLDDSEKQEALPEGARILDRITSGLVLSSLKMPTIPRGNLMDDDYRILEWEAKKTARRAFEEARQGMPIPNPPPGGEGLLDYNIRKEVYRVYAALGASNTKKSKLAEMEGGSLYYRNEDGYELVYDFLAGTEA